MPINRKSALCPSVSIALTSAQPRAVVALESTYQADRTLHLPEVAGEIVVHLLVRVRPVGDRRKPGRFDDVKQVGRDRLAHFVASAQKLRADGGARLDIAASDRGSLASRLRAFEARYNQAAQPFDWRFNRTDLTQLLTRIAA